MYSLCPPPHTHTFMLRPCCHTSCIHVLICKGATFAAYAKRCHTSNNIHDTTVCYHNDKRHQHPSHPIMLPYVILFRTTNRCFVCFRACRCISRNLAFPEQVHVFFFLNHRFLTRGPAFLYICLSACASRRGPVTAEEEDCICGGTARLQRGVEILRET